MEAKASLFLSVVSEYVAAELIEAAGKSLEPNTRQDITTQAMRQAIKRDPEFQSIFNGYVNPFHNADQKSSMEQFKNKVNDLVL